MKIEYLSTDQVKLNPDNPRQITKAKMAVLVKSLQDCPTLFDARPLLISTRTGENIIIGGNMRYRAAKQLQYDKVPCVILPELTEAQEKEIAIKDNGSWGEWDYDILANEWSDLPLNDWGVDSLNFDIPDNNKEIDEKEMADTKNECPKCGFKW
jgi:ParB-like chromosome segregation protein Spo0J